jgi:hypothetical protein
MTPTRPARTRVEALGIAAERRVEHEQRAAARPGGFLGRGHQCHADAAPARASVHQELSYIGAVRLVGRQREPELHGADDAAGNARHEQRGLAPRDFPGDFREERLGVLMLVRRHEAHRRAAGDAIDQNLCELGEIRCGDGFNDSDFGRRVHAARSRFSATVESALSR